MSHISVKKDCVIVSADLLLAALQAMQAENLIIDLQYADEKHPLNLITDYGKPVIGQFVGRIPAGMSKPQPFALAKGDQGSYELKADLYTWREAVVDAFWKVLLNRYTTGATIRTLAAQGYEFVQQRIDPETNETVLTLMEY